jgi:sulfofructose kinase
MSWFVKNISQTLLFGEDSPMRSREFQVFGLGQCSLDYIGKIDAYPLPDSKCEFTDMAIQGGGPVATALVALRRWGVTCTFSGVVGDDPFGRAIVASLDDEGIDLTGLLTRRGAGSQFAFVTAEAGGRRTIFWRRPTGPPPEAGEVPLSLLRRARVFHTDGIFPEAALAAACSARRAGVAVVVDAGSLREGMLDLARQSDFFLASEPFARALIGDDDPREACRRLGELGPGLVAVTLGERGCVALVDGEFIEQPAWPVEATDTTGCGDVFHGGFIYGLLQGWKADRSLAYASWAAAMASRRLGGREGIPPAGEYPEASV